MHGRPTAYADRNAALLAHLAALDVHFEDPELMEQAFRTTSYANEHGLLANDALAFLGDRVLGLIVASRLVTMDDRASSKGALDDRLKPLVMNENLAPIAYELGLVAHLRLGRSFEGNPTHRVARDHGVDARARKPNRRTGRLRDRDPALREGMNGLQVRALARPGRRPRSRWRSIPGSGRSSRCGRCTAATWW